MFWVCLCLMVSGLQARILYVVDIGQQDSVSLGEKVAAQACQGLMNRGGEDAVFTMKEGWDTNWLDTALELHPDWQVETLSAADFISGVCASQNFPKILYSKETHHEIIPQLITLAGVLDSVPLDTDTNMDELAAWQDQEVSLDALAVFPVVSEYVATEYIFDNYGGQTTGVAMMNPGWRQPDDLHPLEHELVRDPDVGLTDYIVKNKIFNFFLYTGCVPLTDHHRLMTRIMTDPNTSWKKPVEVFGYNDAVHFFGSIFEAETNCISAHNMGQVASSGCNNFSFFNRRPSIQSGAELEDYLSGSLLATRKDIAAGRLVYDPSTTYMSFIIGDGDNIAFMKGGRRGWMEERVSYCQSQDSGACSVPLVFSMSPHLTYLAPDWLHWYYRQANISGPDVFALPPSGHLYAYPGMMPGEMQESFMSSTNQDCETLLATGSVHWEWFYGWGQTFDTYFPRYIANNSCINSFFATNVPYNFPTDVLWEDHYKSLERKVFVFKPREWRGTNPDGAPPFSGANYLTEAEMAEEINNYSPGSVSHLYLTSDGGMNLPTLYTMIDLLAPHVKVVNHEELTEMARQRSEMLMNL